MKNVNRKKVTLQDFLEAEEKAVMEMAKYMHDMNCSEEDDETMGMMLSLIVQVTTKMQGILFGKETETIKKVFDVRALTLEKLGGEGIVIVDEKEEM